MDPNTKIVIEHHSRVKLWLCALDYAVGGPGPLWWLCWRGGLAEGVFEGWRGISEAISGWSGTGRFPEDASTKSNNTISNSPQHPLDKTPHRMKSIDQVLQCADSPRKAAENDRRGRPYGC